MNEMVIDGEDTEGLLLVANIPEFCMKPCGRERATMARVVSIPEIKKKKTDSPNTNLVRIMELI